MKRFSLYILIFTLIVGSFVFLPTEKVEAQVGNIPACQYAQGGILITPLPCRLPDGTVLQPPAPNTGTNCFWSLNLATCLSNAAGFVIGGILYIVLSIFSLIIGIAGSFLDYVITTTIVGLRDLLTSFSGINVAWKVVKDLLNIAFIFILVYEGIKMIVGQGSRENVKRFIGMLVLASLLVNFSLFFTKVMIDASNIVTVGLYDTIVDRNAPPVTVAGYNVTGISGPYMRALGLSSFWSSTSMESMRNSVGGDFNLIMTPLLGIFLFMVVSFVFGAMAVMLVVRFITIIILLMLSPIAFMGIALPLVSPYSKQWWNTLNGQLIFPPVFMLMTWISLTLMTSNGFFTGGDWGAVVTNPGAPGTMQLILSFVIIIGLALGSLIVAKSTASQGSKMIGEMTGRLNGFAGGAIYGGLAAAGRNTAGRYGGNVADRAQLQEDAQTKKGLSGAWARTKLYTARTARDASYDTRNATVPTSAAGDVVRGTLGRTAFGKAIGADDFRTSNIEVGKPVNNIAGLGVGGKSYGDTQAEKAKRLGAEQNKDKEELKLSKARDDINKGANANATDPGYATLIDKMEKALATLSTKETEALVDSNRELLSKQEFANRISVKQLEALEKSDKFSEEEKESMKTNRFKVIDDITSTDPDKVKAATGRIKGLSDSEIEMLSTTQLSNTNIVSQFRPAQFESIAKSGKFTASQKKSIKDIRMNPLLDALDTSRTTHAPGTASYAATIKSAIRKGLTAKDVAGLMSTKATFVDLSGATVTESALTHPEVMKQMTPNLLKRMAQEMSTEDIQTLREKILDAATTPGAATTPDLKQLMKTAEWLEKDDGEINFS